MGWHQEEHYDSEALPRECVRVYAQGGHVLRGQGGVGHALQQANVRAMCKAQEQAQDGSFLLWEGRASVFLNLRISLSAGWNFDKIHMVPRRR